MITKRLLLPMFAVMALAFTTTSCELVDNLFEDKVVTLINNVRMERRDAAVPADLSLLPEGVRETLKEKDMQIVVVDKADVMDPNAATIDVLDPGEGWVGNAIDIGLSFANTVWPGIAALEALGLLFSRRKRRHYGAAVVSAAPTNGKMELKDAVVSLGRAIGVAHSSEASKEAFEGEKVQQSAG